MKKNQKTIWYCHHYAGSPSLGMSYRPYYLTQAFCAADSNAFVINASYHHLQHQTQAHSPSQTAAVEYKKIDGVPFLSLKTNKYRNNGLGRFLNILTYVYRLYRNHEDIVAITGRPDVIIVSSGHLFHYPILEKMAKKYKAKLIFEVRDLWPLSLIELMKIKRFNPLILWLSRIERRAYTNADYVVSVLEAVFPYMNKKGLTKARFRIIPNGVSVKLFQNQQSLDAQILNKITKEKESGKFLLGYAGSLGIPNAMEYLVRAMGQLSEENVPIHCFILGDGSLKKQLQQIAQELKLKNISFLPAIPKYEIPAFLSMLDAVYLGWLPADMYKFGVSPNKIFDYMMSGKPIIESGCEQEGLVGKFNCGIQCASANAEAIADAIIDMYHLPPSTRKQMGANGIQGVQKYHDYTFLAAKYMELFDA